MKMWMRRRMVVVMQVVVVVNPAERTDEDGQEIFFRVLTFIWSTNLNKNTNSGYNPIDDQIFLHLFVCLFSACASVHACVCTCLSVCVHACLWVFMWRSEDIGRNLSSPSHAWLQEIMGRAAGDFAYWTVPSAQPDDVWLEIWVKTWRQLCGTRQRTPSANPLWLKPIW